MSFLLRTHVLFWTSCDACSGFQSLEASLASVLSHLCDPQIHLSCDTCWLYGGRLISWAFLIYIPVGSCVHKHWWEFKLMTVPPTAQCCKPFGHSGSESGKVKIYTDTAPCVRTYFKSTTVPNLYRSLFVYTESPKILFPENLFPENTFNTHSHWEKAEVKTKIFFYVW